MVPIGRAVNIVAEEEMFHFVSPQDSALTMNFFFETSLPVAGADGQCDDVGSLGRWEGASR